MTRDYLAEVERIVDGSSTMIPEKAHLLALLNEVKGLLDELEAVRSRLQDALDEAYGLAFAASRLADSIERLRERMADGAPDTAVRAES